MALQSIAKIIMAMILMLLIMYLAYRVTRFLAERTMKGGKRGNYLREFDRLGMGPEQYIAIVRAGSSYYLIGVTKQNISILSEISEEQLVELPEEEREVVTGGAANSEFYRKLAERTGGLGFKGLFPGRKGNDRGEDDQ